MGTTVAVGTTVIYGLSALYATFNSFKLAFLTAATVVFVVSAVWLLVFNMAESKAKHLMYMEENNAEEITVEKTKKTLQGNEKRLFFTTVVILCIFAVGVNLTKDGLTTWVPAILKEEFLMSDSLSVLLTLFLPIVAIFANACSLKIHKKIPDYINQCFVTFSCIACFVGVIIACLSLKQSVIMLVSLVIVSFLAATLNSLITSIFPLFAREKVESGKIAGILNGFCYLGSTLSSYGLGYIADHFKWVYVFWILIGFCGFAAVVWMVYTYLKIRLSKKI
jgi:OPA family glycerol-3-phosphate transporter-like MFS transporter